MRSWAYISYDEYAFSFDLAASNFGLKYEYKRSQNVLAKIPSSSHSFISLERLSNMWKSSQALNNKKMKLNSFK